MDCEVLASLAQGEAARILGEAEGDEFRGSARWFRIALPGAGAEAWVHSALLEVAAEGEAARVLRVVDGDTIDVEIEGQRARVRYIGVNTPERDEPCAAAATEANARLVAGGEVRLLRDVSEEDRYGRLLRYVHAEGVFVNEALVREGYAENSVWEPDTQYAARFRALEAEARAAGRGCHASGVFADGDTER